MDSGAVDISLRELIAFDSKVSGSKEVLCRVLPYDYEKSGEKEAVYFVFSNPESLGGRFRIFEKTIFPGLRQRPPKFRDDFERRRIKKLRQMREQGKVRLDINFEIYSYIPDKHDEVRNKIKKNLPKIVKLLDEKLKNEIVPYASVVIVFNIDPFGTPYVAGTLIEDADNDLLDYYLCEAVEKIKFPASAGDTPNTVVAVFHLEHNILEAARQSGLQNGKTS